MAVASARLSFFEVVRFDNPRAEFADVNGLTGYVIAKGAPEDVDIGVFFYDIESVRCVPAAHCTSLGLDDHAARDHSKWAVAKPVVKRRHQ